MKYEQGAITKEWYEAFGKIYVERFGQMFWYAGLLVSIFFQP